MTISTINPHTWLQEHGDYLYRYAMSRLHNAELAQDMLQETMLAAWRGRENFAGKSTVRTWLVGILKHKIVDYIRKDVRGRNLTDALESDPTSEYFDAHGEWVDSPSAWKENPEELCNNEQFKKVLEQCVCKLPEKQQVVFRMRDVLGEDTPTICEQCDITPTHLHVLLHRARMALRQGLNKHWFEKENRS